MHHYTLFLLHEGGVVLRQVPAKTPGKALDRWSKEIIEHFDLKGQDQEQFLKSLEGEEATPVESLKGVWCSGCLIKSKLGLVHIILTAST